MKKKILIPVAAALAVLLLVLSIMSLSFRRISVVSGAEYVDECPGYARPGRTVTVMTASVSDGEIFVNGADGEYVRPGEYVFIMPDRDVRLSVHVTAFPDRA